MAVSSAAQKIRHRGSPAHIPPARAVEIEAFLRSVVPPGRVPSHAELGAVTAGIASRRELWSDLAVHDATERWYTLVYRSPEYDLWLLSWLPGQDTDWHDHGGSSGSFAVAEGELTEQWRRGARRIGSHVVRAGEHVAFGPTHLHNVAHHGDEAAVSVHCYSPALTVMTYYALESRGLRAVETVRSDAPDGRGWERLRQPATRHLSIDDVLADARNQIDRVSPREAARLLAEGAALVDIRPIEYREAEGEVPGSFVIERNVLEWRLDPLNEARIKELADYDKRIIIMCNEGYASSLAAADLRRLGHRRVADLDGGFRSWKAAGLPVRAFP